jgi:hypothetical protein
MTIIKCIRFLAQNRGSVVSVLNIMFLGSKARLVRKADNLAAIYEPIV